jgi:hypothetical protein
VARIGIGLIGMPRILRDVITTIVADQPDMEIVGEVPENADVSEVDALGASFLTVGLDPSGVLPPTAGRLLSDRNAVPMLGLSAEGRHGYLYELRPHRQPIGEVSPDVLLSTIRSAVRSP